MAYRAYKFRLKPTKDQEGKLLGQLETLRRTYNTVLAYWNAKGDAWAEAHPVTEKKPRPKLTKDERTELKRKKDEEKAAKKLLPKKPKNHKKTDEQRALEQEQWARDREPGLNEVYHFLTTLHEPSDDPKRPLPKYLDGSLILMSMLRDTAERVRKAFKRYGEIASGQIVIPKAKKPRKDGRPHGYPRFKRYQGLTSIAFAQYVAGCKLRSESGHVLRENAPLARTGCTLDVSCVGRIKVRVHRAVEGVIKSASVSRDVDGRWYVSLTCEIPDPVIVPNTLPPVGIDVGLEHFLTTSAGRHEPNPRILKGRLKRLARFQRAVARKREAAKSRAVKLRDLGSNYKTAQHRVARLHVKVRNLRKELHHKAANSLVREAGTVCVEALNVRGMLGNDKLARSISDVAWGGFLLVLKHTAHKAGVTFVEVDAKGTSQTCPACGAVEKKKLSQRTHDCPCGYKTHRDHAAAQVILHRGTGSEGPDRSLLSAPPGAEPLGMPREQSGGGGVGQLKSPANITPKAIRTRTARGMSLGDHKSKDSEGTG